MVSPDLLKVLNHDVLMMLAGRAHGEPCDAIMERTHDSVGLGSSVTSQRLAAKGRREKLKCGGRFGGTEGYLP